MSRKLIVIANEAAAVAELTAGAKTMGDEVVLITPAEVCGAADRVYCWDGAGSMAVQLAGIAKIVENEAPALVLCDNTPDGRLAAGCAAGLLNTSPLCDVSEIVCGDDAVETARLVHGGGAVKRERCAYPAVLTVPAGSFEPAAEGAAEAVPFPACESALELVGVDALEILQVNLAAAKRVIAAGRGLSGADNIPSFEKLAAKLGAEIGCTRPVAEEEHWYGKERYIGVSGCMLKPNFYMAVGISGQIQHMVGVNQAGVIFAIDKNENAPIINQADYTLVGDVNTVLPALLEKLG